MCLQIIDNVPKDTKGRVLLFLYLGREGAVAYGKQTLDVIVIQACVQLSPSIRMSNFHHLTSNESLRVQISLASDLIYLQQIYRVGDALCRPWRVSS